MSILINVDRVIRATLTDDLAFYLSDKLGVDVQEIQVALSEYLGNEKITTPIVRDHQTTTSPKIKDQDPTTVRCIFRYTRGEKEGQICNTAIRGDGEYCSKHRERKVNTELLIKRNTNLKCWMAGDTNYVVESSTSKIVIGKITRGKIVKIGKTDHKKITALNLNLPNDTE